MAERDGTIVIDTQIDTKGVDAGSEKTEASLRRMAQKVNDIGATAKAALNKQIDAFARLNSQYDSQSEKIDALKRKIAGYSDEYGEMQAKIDETVKKLNDLEMMQGVIKDAVKDSAKRGTTFDTTQYKWVQEDIEKLTKEIEVAEREQDKLFATGNPFELGSKARAAKEDLEKLSQEEGKLADMHNKLQTAYTVQASTITKTQKEMTDLKYKLEHGLYVKKEKITLMEWYETWLEEYKKNRVKIGTYTSYEKYYKSTINNRLGNKELSEIRGEHIQKLYNDMVKEGYAISSIKIVSAILNGCLQQAMKNGLIERNPVKLAELPRQTGTKKERTAMTKEQQDLFMKYAEESYLYHFFSVMLRTGMRKGEMQGLKYSDIDKKQNVIHVRRTLKYIEGKGYFEDTPKTRTSTRDIPLTAAITEHIEAQRKYWGFKVVRMDQYLFCNENGDPISRERIQGEIDRIIKRIKSDGYDFPRITSHVFRHTFATRAIEAGMPPQVLKTILGHSSLAMTMDLYSHVLPDTKADEMQKIANVF